MKPKRKQRSKKNRESRGKASHESQKSVEARPAAVEPSAPSVTHDVAMRARSVGRFLLCVVAVYALIGTYLILRVHISDGSWPGPRDAGLTMLLGAVVASALVLSSLLLVPALRAVNSRKWSRARWLLSGAILCGLMAVGVRGVEYFRLFQEGVFPGGTPRRVHDRADLYYVQDVRQRLKQHQLRLEDQSLEQPDALGDDEQRQLELINDLQTNMVAWTEREIGHWLDDLNERTSLIKVLAYQIRPMERNRTTVEARAEVEKDAMDRNRRRFKLLREYCERKSELLGRLKESSQQAQAKLSAAKRISKQPAGNEAALPDQSRSDPDGTAERERLEKQIESLKAEIEQIDLGVHQKLKEMGGNDWAFADSLAGDTSDLAMAGERLNQIDQRLQHLDARAVFVRQRLDPLFEQSHPLGLNVEYRWLRLPVYLPNGYAWVNFYFLATGTLGALLLVGIGGLVVGWPQPSNRWAVVRLRPAVWFWHTIVLSGVILFVMFYCL